MFQEEFLSKLKNLLPNDKSPKSFQDSFLQILNFLAPLKTKYARANKAPFMNKELQKAIIIGSNKSNKFLKKRTESNKKAYSKQRNICVNILRKTKKHYYSNLEVNKVADNKKFWKIGKQTISKQLL